MTPDDLRAALLAMVERRPISDLPDEGAVSFVDNGTEVSPGSRRVAAKFKDGKWVRLNGQPIPFEPTHWFRIHK